MTKKKSKNTGLMRIFIVGVGIFIVIVLFYFYRGRNRLFSAHLKKGIVCL